MPSALVAVQPLPGYDERTTIGPYPTGRDLILIIDAQGPCYYQLAYLTPSGNAAVWNQFEHNMSGYTGIIRNVQGIRFRQGDPVKIPRVTAYLLLKGEPIFDTITANTFILSSTGVPSN